MKLVHLVVIEALIFGLLLCGCQPGNGNFQTDEVGQEIPDEETPPIQTGDLLTEIQKNIFSPICAQCHIGSSAPAGLQLDDAVKAIANLVDVQAIGNPGFKRVVANDPDNSYLMKKILGDPVAGQRMPLGMGALSNSQIQLISDWIAQGALPASNNSFSKISNIKTAETSNSFEVIINFDKAVDKNSLMYSSLPVFQIIDQQKYQLALDSYEFHLINSQQLNISIPKNDLLSNQLSIELGQISQMPLLSLNGQLIDVDADNQEGGSYVIKINQ